MVVGVVSIALGLLALAFFWWFPTATLVLGATAVAAGLVGRRLQGGRRLSNIGALLGIATISATLIVVVLTTDF